MSQFIKEYELNDKSICDDLIEFFKKHPNKKPGCTGNGLDIKHKKSIDVTLFDNKELIIQKYLNELQVTLDKYISDFPFCNYYAPFSITEPINIQYYDKGDAYYEWHTERSGVLAPVCYRHLVFTTYLNDVDDDGETEFYHQNLKVKAKKGKTIIFPADWTHTHRGVPSKTEEKYIITGWFNYINKV